MLVCVAYIVAVTYYILVACTGSIQFPHVMCNNNTSENMSLHMHRRIHVATVTITVIITSLVIVM